MMHIGWISQDWQICIFPRKLQGIIFLKFPISPFFSFGRNLVSHLIGILGKSWTSE